VAASVQQYPRVAVAETLSGVPGIVDLWYWFYETTAAAALDDAGLPLMTGDEHERYRRFRFERDRRLFLATRLLVRSVLSRYAEVAPADWRFVADRAGKPRIAEPAVRPTLYFNLANTRGLVVCGITVAHQLIGVDVERTGRTVDYTALASRFFSGAEARDLAALAADRRPRRFFEYWTLKESYVKARGVGLGLPLDQFAFSITGERIAVAFHAPSPDAESHWRFALIDAGPEHQVAVGVNTDGAGLSLRTEAFSPGASGAGR